MKYFIDTEFLEGKQKEIFPISLFRKETPNTIDLISIGIVSEDNRGYYAISKDFNLKEAWNRFDLKINKHYPMGPEYLKEYWIRENVLRQIFNEWKLNTNSKILRLGLPINELKFNYKNFKYCIKCIGKPNKQIAEEIKEFVYSNGDRSMHRKFGVEHLQINRIVPEFYAYYADYDWVVFCWLFGKMIDLPEGFPKYCIDLKQEFDIQENSFKSIESLKEFMGYPKQENEHNALEDARWNYNLYKFLTNFK